MRCPACQQSLTEGSLRCPSCGADLSQLPTQEATPSSYHPVPGALDFAPGTAFAGRFTIIERVGSGGMGVVYKAIDRTLHQEVALKLLRPELAGEASYVERFKREVRVARQLGHPNVCRVFDLGESDGVLFFAMEWVHGETLHDLLARAGKLEEARALEIAEKIARGLQAAHERGIVHRDLNPRNVMLDDGGRVLVMDFGVAAEAGERTLTGPFRVVGTPGYMAPEQLAGGHVDGRADLFSLGLVLGKMITGQRPATRHPHDPTERHGTTRATAGVLSHLLAPAPEGRFVTAAAAAEALASARARHLPAGLVAGWRRQLRPAPVAAALLLLLSIAGLVWWLFPHPPDPRELFPSPAEAFFRRGTFYLREESETLRSIDDAVHMFERSVTSDSTFAPAWAGLAEAYWMRFERTKNIVAREEAARAEQRAVTLRPAAALTRIAQARGLIALGKFPEARKILELVVQEDPGNDVAWGNLGRACRGQECYEQGLEAIRRAIALRPESFRHHAEMGAFLQRSGEYEAAEKEFRRAIELKPESPTAWINLGASYLHQGDWKDATSALEQALRYEQRPETYTNLGTAYYFAGDYPRASTNYRKAAESDTINALSAGNLGDALRMQGDRRAAVAAYREAVRRARAVLAQTPADLTLRMQLALWYARCGESAAALDEAARATRAQPEDPTVLFKNGVIRATLGLDGEALDWLEKAAKLGCGRAEMENDPDLARLRTNPRFQRILALAS